MLKKYIKKQLLLKKAEGYLNKSKMAILPIQKEGDR